MTDKTSLSDLARRAALADELLEQLILSRNHIALLNKTLSNLASLGATIALCGVQYDEEKVARVISKAKEVL